MTSDIDIIHVYTHLETKKTHLIMNIKSIILRLIALYMPLIMYTMIMLYIIIIYKKKLIFLKSFAEDTHNITCKKLQYIKIQQPSSLMSWSCAFPTRKDDLYCVMSLMDILFDLSPVSSIATISL